MNARVLALLAILFALLLAGCSFKSETDDGDSETTLSAGEEDDNDAPGASVGAIVSVLGVALLARRRLQA